MSKRITKEEFIENAIKKHDGKYIYEYVNFINMSERVTITCPIHGNFEQTPSNHISSNGCQECGKINSSEKRKIKLEDFIEKSNVKHENKYDYSLVKYDFIDDEVIIICPVHGEFKQKARQHMESSGCQKCSGYYMGTEFFIEKSNVKHNFKYDYSKSIYTNSKTNVIIICPIHGEFLQNPGHHMNGSGCSKCYLEAPSPILSNTEEFIDKANLKHENKYTYEKTIYVKNRTHVIITCPTHGDFEQTPFGHLQGNGCRQCYNDKNSEKLTIKQEDVINRFIEAHGNKYDYSKVIYTGLDDKVIIICPDHGEFEQTPHMHWYKQGCPKCIESRLETTIRVLLENNEIEYVYEKKFEWLGKQSVDFYLPKYNIAIECQGEQHFRTVDFFGGEKRFKYILKLDKNKNKLCSENNVKLLYFSDIILENYDLGKIFNNTDDLLKEIIN